MPRRAAIGALLLGAVWTLAACGPDAPAPADAPAEGPSGAGGLAAVRLALDAGALPAGVAEVELRLTRPDAEPRVLRAPVEGVGVLLWVGGLAPGPWLARVEGFDGGGRTILCGFGAAELVAGQTQSLRVPLVAAQRCEPHEDDCSDGRDDDVDGAADCADADCDGLVCAISTTCGPASLCGGGVCVAGPPGDCDDDDPCTVDTCELGRICAHEPVVCDDGDACTADACDPLRGCVAPARSCDDGDACTTDGCDPASGCTTEPVVCADGDACTTDGCDPDVGCTFAPIPGCVSDCGPVVGGCPAGFACVDERCLSPDDELLVPGGTFAMGCDPADPDDFLCGVFTWEQPPHDVTVSTFVMARTEVRRGDYQPCVDDGACAPFGAAAFCGGTADHPVNCAAWQDAADYCAWAGRRLCTEAEWEYAARGSDGRPRPWGDAPADCTLAHLAAQPAPDHGCGTGATAPVGSYPAGASPFGVLDLVGNVSEWTADWYDAAYYAASPAVDPTGPATGDRHVFRGGNYLQTDPLFARASERGFGSDVDRDAGQDGTGIRCCRDLPACAVLGEGAACDDGDPCTTDSTCQAGDCAGGRPACDDGDACTIDTCDAGTCGHQTIPEGGACDDGCWTDSRCTMGACAPGPTPVDCDDGDPCTIDTCLLGEGCRHDPCPAGYTCAASTCVATAPTGGLELRHVPGGPFWMGCTEVPGDPQCFAYTDARRHGVTLSPFDVTTLEASVQNFIDCNAAGAGPCAGVSACTAGVPFFSYAEYPVGCLNRADAAALCAWAGLRLCTEAEWEKAARGPDGRSYPWGNTEPDCTRAVMDETGVVGGAGCGSGATLPVGSRPAGASPYGALDLLGNAAEWVADGYDATYYQTGPTTDPPGPATTTPGVARGGLFSSSLVNPQFLFAWYRESVNPTTGPFSMGRYGVRCCRDAP